MNKIAVLDLNTLTKGDLDFSAIEALGTVKYFDSMPAEDIPGCCSGCEVLLVNKADINRQVIEKMPELKYVGVFATGYNNIDLNAARERNIDVVNVPGYSTDSVAQLVWAFVLELATNIHKYDDSVQRGDWAASETFSYFPFPIMELSGKVMGIVGYGAIGRKVARIADVMGMKVKIYSRRKYEDCPFEQVDKEELF